MLVLDAKIYEVGETGNFFPRIVVDFGQAAFGTCFVLAALAAVSWPLTFFARFPLATLITSGCPWAFITWLVLGALLVLGAFLAVPIFWIFIFALLVFRPPGASLPIFFSVCIPVPLITRAITAVTTSPFSAATFLFFFSFRFFL